MLSHGVRMSPTQKSPGLTTSFGDAALVISHHPATLWQQLDLPHHLPRVDVPHSHRIVIGRDWPNSGKLVLVVI